MDVRAALPKHPVPSHIRHELRLDGLVRRRMLLHAVDLADLERVDLSEAFTCEEGWQVPGLTWRGVRLVDVLALAGPLPEAAWVRVSSGEFAVPLPFGQIADAILAEALNGEPLGHDHGAPWRLVAPGGSCFTSVKWVDCIELSASPGEASGERIARARLSRGR